MVDSGRGQDDDLPAERASSGSKRQRSEAPEGAVRLHQSRSRCREVVASSRHTRKRRAPNAAIKLGKADTFFILREVYRRRSIRSLNNQTVAVEPKNNAPPFAAATLPNRDSRCTESAGAELASQQCQIFATTSSPREYRLRHSQRFRALSPAFEYSRYLKAIGAHGSDRLCYAIFGVLRSFCGLDHELSQGS